MKYNAWQSRRGLTPVDEALHHMLSDLTCVAGTEEVYLRQAAGRILASDHHAEIDVPPFANSAMDGYALEASALAAGQRRFVVSGRVAAGDSPGELPPGTAMRIFTGAPLPAGADTVVTQENCNPVSGDQPAVIIEQSADAGANVRHAGSDIRGGSLLLRAGRRLRAADVGTLAACGVDRLRVRRVLDVAVLPTGNELVLPGEPLRPGQIYDSNSVMLCALLSGSGFRVADAGGVVPDSREATREALRRAAGTADAVVTNGGVSVGDEDHVRAVLQEEGQLALWKLALKPGKPFTYGWTGNEEKGRTPFFGLPGNPVSACVAFLLLVRPALLKMAGAQDTALPVYRIPAGFSRPESGERQEYLRVRLVGGESVTGQTLLPLPDQSSGVLTSVSQASGLAVIPPFTPVREGDILEFIPFTNGVD